MNGLSCVTPISPPPTVSGDPCPGLEDESGPPSAQYGPALWAALAMGTAKNADRTALW